MTNEKNTTPLSALPKNTDNDTDLVNKILNQLDTSNDSTPPTFELETPPAEKPSPKPASGSPPRKLATPPDVRPAQPAPLAAASRTPQSMPSPQGIQNVLNSMDMDYIYKIAKMCLYI